MSNFTCSILAACLFASLLVPSKLGAQQEQIEKPDFGDGVFEVVAENMERLIKLKWDGENIGLLRNWREAMTPEEKEESQKYEQAVLELVDRGVPEYQAKRFAAQKLGLGPNFAQPGNTACQKLFFRIRGTKGGRSGITGGHNTKLTFSTKEISGSANLAEEDVRFSFEETTNQQRRFEFHDNGDGEVTFRFEHGDLFLRLHQSQDGHTQLIWIENDQAKVYVGRTFQQFTKNNPQVAERAIFSLFARLGIKGPMDITDPRVVANVVAKIKRAKEGSDESVRKLIKELGSDSFEVRENASKTLADGYQNWAAIINEHLADSSLSPEAEFRLNEIVDGATESEINKLIREQRLLDSPEYMVSLLNIIDPNEKPLIVEHLEKLTKQSHGDDTSAWETWLQDQK